MSLCIQWDQDVYTYQDKVLKKKKELCRENPLWVTRLVCISVCLWQHYSKLRRQQPERLGGHHDQKQHSREECSVHWQDWRTHDSGEESSQKVLWCTLASVSQCPFQKLPPKLKNMTWKISSHSQKQSWIPQHSLSYVDYKPCKEFKKM